MVLLYLIFIPSLALSTIVTTPYGDIEGFEYVTDSGVPTQVFLGIRYGKATNGSRRFQKPEMVEKWAPGKVSAKEFGASCDSFTASRTPGTIFSEDCLFLNIIAPKMDMRSFHHRDPSGKEFERRFGSDLPVFFYIHGGFYEAGSSTALGYKNLVEKMASQGIVVVTFNYRLGPFGFFSLGDASAPGNMGMWDQTLALRFAREILPSFGGDPSRITIGAFFSQSILISGSSLAEFAQSEMVVEESRKLVREFDCPLSTSELALNCLRKRTPDEIYKAVDKIGTSRRHPNVVVYNPRIDGDFFPHPISELAKAAPKKRVLAGVTDQESALFTMNEKLTWLAAIALTEKEQKSFSRKDLLKFIETVVVTDKEFMESAPAFRQLLVDFYAGKNETGQINLNLAHDWSTFLYILQHNTKSFPREKNVVQGTYHGDELEHFTDSFSLFPLKKDEKEDHAFGRNFASSMTNFIKNGDPSSPSFKWDPVSKDHPYQYASITVNMTMKQETYRADAARLWLETIPRSVSTELLRKTRLPGA